MKCYIDLKNGIEYDKIKIAAEKIKQGGIVIFPTDTVLIVMPLKKFMKQKKDQRKKQLVYLLAI